MKAKVLGFGEIELDGERYDHDIVIQASEVKKRKKGVSKRFRDEYGHTPSPFCRGQRNPQLCPLILVNSSKSWPHPPTLALVLCKMSAAGPYGWQMKTALIVIAVAAVAITGISLAAALGHTHHHMAFVRVVWPGHWIFRR